MRITEGRLRGLIRQVINENMGTVDELVIVEAHPMGKNRSRPQKIDDYEFFKSLIDLGSVEFEPIVDDPFGYSWGACFDLKLSTNLPHDSSTSEDEHDIDIEVFDENDLNKLVDDENDLNKLVEKNLNISNYFMENVSSKIFIIIFKKLTPGRSTAKDLRGRNLWKVMAHHKETIIQKLNKDLIEAIEKKYERSLSDIILDFFNRE